jgi:hypothetical protein
VTLTSELLILSEISPWLFDEAQPLECAPFVKRVSLRPESTMVIAIPDESRNACVFEGRDGSRPFA